MGFRASGFQGLRFTLTLMLPVCSVFGFVLLLQHHLTENEFSPFALLPVLGACDHTRNYPLNFRVRGW